MGDTIYKCLSDSNCFVKTVGNYCGASDFMRRTCKQYERVKQVGQKNLKIYGVIIHIRNEDRDKIDPEKSYRTQARYIALVSSQKEFAELIGSSIDFVRNYAGITGNPKEIELALANPHKLIFIKIE